MDNSSIEESIKQGKGYLSKIYSLQRRPITNYPNELANYIKLNFIDKEFKKKNLAMLDLGCGRGDMLRAFKKIGFSVSGVDLSSESINYNKPINVIKYNVENNKVPKTLVNKFDIIFSKSLIEHLKEPMKFLINAKKMLKGWYNYCYDAQLGPS